ncbi:MAG: hypothetical protein JWM96_1417, partial [Alphaproteobacteria bacterium]|nr:hypothetical protein [Alphaproteobacteria bacterium]
APPPTVITEEAMQHIGDTVLAVDMGGTKLETALVSSDGVIQSGSRQRRLTGQALSREAVEANLRDAIALTLSSAAGPVVGAGVGSAGPVDLPVGSISPHNLPALHSFPIQRLVESVSGLPTTLRLDGTCIALAEHWLGATRGSSTSMAIVVSTGVGGGIIADGRLLAGGTGNAGHIGQIHVAVEATEPEGSTLEAVASGPSSVRYARSRGWTGHTGEELAAAFRAGDLMAEAATRRSAYFVGQAIASAATLLDIDVVALGGGFANVRADYVEIVQASAVRNAIFPYARRVRVVPSGHAGDGPLLGAAALRFCADMLSRDIRSFAAASP